MKRIILITIFCLTFYMIGKSQSMLITGRIVNENKIPVPDALVMICSQDSVIISTTLSDSIGYFHIQTESIPSPKFKISCLGYRTKWGNFPINGDIVLISDNHLLSEVIVKGRRNLTKQTSTGFTYDLSSINFIKSQNLLQALRLVPFLEVNYEGEISVKGDKQYMLYMNGKPFDIGMANPVQILKSIPAKNIKQIEIVTETDSRFNNNIPVINILTASNSLEGLYLNGSAKYESVPNAQAGLSILTKKDRVDFSFSYDYDYKNQHNQPIFQSITSPENTVTLNGRGKGYWHTHTLRALSSLRINSQNIIYADLHAKINNDFYKTQWLELTEQKNREEESNWKSSRSSVTKGTLETNLIYRNYFKHNSKKEHFMVGYRYTYNPDKRNFTLSQPVNNSSTYTQKTNGGLNEHTLDAKLIIPFSRNHQLSIDARTIYRDAELNSTDNSGLSYTQSITYPNLYYIGTFKWFKASLNFSCEYDYLSMTNLHDANTTYHSKNVYFLPTVNVYRTLKKWRVNLNYKRSLQRPSITMLNPFFNSENNYFHQIGNPHLKAEIKDLVSFGASFFKREFNMSVGLSYSNTDNAILSYQNKSSDLLSIISTYDNIGKVNTFTGNIFANWQPVSSLIFKLNINGGLYNIQSKSLNLSQKDYTLNVFGWVDYYFSTNWSVGANVIHFKQAPEPFGSINSITKYSIHVEKSWMKGALSTSLEISNPFRKYSNLESTVTTSMFSTKRINFMTTRYLGLNISYTLQNGQKSKLKRDSSLINNDQNSGVQ